MDERSGAPGEEGEQGGEGAAGGEGEGGTAPAAEVGPDGEKIIEQTTIEDYR